MNDYIVNSSLDIKDFLDRIIKNENVRDPKNENMIDQEQLNLIKNIELKLNAMKKQL